MSEKRIIFNLENQKNHWYDKIASGDKTVEYRRVCRHWGSRLHVTNMPLAKGEGWVEIDGSREMPKDWFAVFRVGYPSKGKQGKFPDIVRRITKIDIGPCPYDGWDGEYFRIHFEQK